MMRCKAAMAMICAAAVSACVAPPPGPTILALPARGKDFGRFQQEDATCRQYADQQSGAISASDASTQNTVGGGVIGTLLGAAAGAAIGAATGNPAAGAAIGAGGGLALGLSSGSSSGQQSAGGIQQGYDNAYAQCQVSYGNRIGLPQQPQAAYAYPPPPPPPVYGYPPPPAYGYQPQPGPGYGYQQPPAPGYGYSNGGEAPAPY